MKAAVDERLLPEDGPRGLPGPLALDREAGPLADDPRRPPRRPTRSPARDALLLEALDRAVAELRSGSARRWTGWRYGQDRT